MGPLPLRLPARCARNDFVLSHREGEDAACQVGRLCHQAWVSPLLHHSAAQTLLGTLEVLADWVSEAVEEEALAVDHSDLIVCAAAVVPPPSSFLVSAQILAWARYVQNRR